MGGVILDTCIWAGIERRKITFADVARVVAGYFILLAPPVLSELEYGIFRADTEAQRIRRKEALTQIKLRPCLVMDNMTAEIHGRLSAMLDNAGKPTMFRTHDIWIAAVAIQHNCAVLTRNARDFEDIPDVRLLTLP